MFAVAYLPTKILPTQIFFDHFLGQYLFFFFFFSKWQIYYDHPK